MLRVLEVRNLALIDNLTFYPGSGFNVITGETGAGKSMLLDALSLLLGERATAESIRNGQESALMQAIFTPALAAPAAPAEEMIFSREIRRSGPNICRINGRVEPLNEMAAAGRALVDLHGQNKQQSLLEMATQRELLDAYGGRKVAEARGNVAALYQKLHQLQLELVAVGGDDAAAARQADFLRFQLAEIRSVELSLDEEAELEKRLRRLSNARQILENTSKIYTDLLEGSYEGSIVDNLGSIEKELAATAALDDSLSDILQQVKSATEQLKDAARELQFYQESVSLDEAELQDVVVRLETYRKIKKKYGPTLQDVATLADQLQAELDEIAHRDAKRKLLSKEILQTTDLLQKAAANLTLLRCETASVLNAQITEALHSVALQDAQFNISILPQQQIVMSGCDHIEFQLTTNMGEPLRSLAKTASGGEISRVMLAIKSVLAKQDEVETLIFDEIDAGIGGLTVRAVADKLKQLSAHRQVICVTHQPLIAAAADHHFTIYKETKAGRTVTRLKKLSQTERELELARMLGGEDEIALVHARKLLA